MNIKRFALELTVTFLIVAIFAVPYVWNFVKFTRCDFKADYRCEAIHVPGVFVPPFAFFTVWFDDDGD